MIYRTLLLAGSILAVLPAAAAYAQSPPSPTTPSPTRPAPARPFDVVHYDARLVPHWRDGTLTGQESIDLRIAADGTRTLVFDRGALTIDAVHAAGRPLAFEVGDARVRMHLPQPAHRGERLRLELDYHGAPRHGLQFQPERQQLYTVYSTSQWLVVVDAPDERATLDLVVALPAAWRAVGTGRERRSVARADGTTLHRWRLSTPMPSYVYGFAAGALAEVRERHGGVRLRYLGADTAGDSLRRLFADTADMLQFFSRSAGVAYGAADYSQALVAQTIGQELAGLSLLPEPAAPGAATRLDEVGLQAHEAAHQWWGNRVTCADWTHFWLNEGFATFMSAAYLQQRYGEAVYRERVARWRRRVEGLRAEGKDRPLVFPDWDHPSADDRALVYQKGAYLLHLLRERMGEKAFWKGIRAYTRAHIDTAVRTRDFEQTMQRHSREDLSPLFREWLGPL